MTVDEEIQQLRDRIDANAVSINQTVATQSIVALPASRGDPVAIKQYAVLATTLAALQRDTDMLQFAHAELTATAAAR